MYLCLRTCLNSPLKNILYTILPYIHRNKIGYIHIKIHACFFSLEMKTTKRSDPSASAVPLALNFLQRKYTFSSLHYHRNNKKQRS